MALDPTNLSDEVTAFLTERHLATLTTLRPDGSLHVVAVGFTWDPGEQLARVITFAPSRKARNVAANPGGPAAVCQVDGGRWLTAEGTATVTDDPDRVAEAVRRYAARYSEPKQRVDRVVIEIAVDRMMGRA
jgi:PPOX class probable F420-dependent enzyme